MTETAEMSAGRRLRKEIIGLIWLALGLFLLLSLLSYSNSDPSFNNNLKPNNITNLGGMIGSHMSDLAFQVIGLPALLLPLFCLVLSWRNFTLKPHHFKFYKLLALLVFLCSLDGLIALRWRAVPYLEQTINEAGGAIGRLLADILVPVLNLPGAAMILVVFLMVSLLLATRFSLVLFLDGLVSRFGETLERRRERREALKAGRMHNVAAKEDGGPVIAAPAPPPKKAGSKKKSKRGKKEAAGVSQEAFDFLEVSGTYHKPPLNLLDHEGEPPIPVDRDSLAMNARLLEKKLQDFGVAGEVSEVKPGPVVTMYEFAPAPGVKVSKISGLSDDLTMALSAMSIRIIAPIPGRSVVGIEIPNKDRQTVYLKEIFESEAFQKAGGKLPMALGKDIFGGIVVSDLSKMPHLLVAGSTGSGKSVSINTMILSLLYRATPEDVRLIMIDPKMLELSIYEEIPHLLLPVVTEAKKAALALNWAVREMERRYRLLADKGVRNIDGYNRKWQKEEAERLKNPPPEEPETSFEDGDDGLPPMPPPSPEEELEHGHLPHIVVIVDELADLMMVAGRELEESIARLAQMARAAGIHLILATQRPSVDVITGLIKANFPTRISFKVFSRTDSRTILDSMGAESLLGMGDMLFLPPGTGTLQRVHGAFVSELEVQRVVEFLKKQGNPEYDTRILEAPAETGSGPGGDEEYDEKWDEALALVADKKQASISMIQRHLRIGYNRAARMIERMEQEGIVGPSDGSGKPRDVLIQPIDA